MTKPFKEWKVLPHGKLAQVDEDILTVVGKIHMPLMDLPRRMTVVRLNDASLIVFSAIALDESEMAALEEYGRPAYLIVPSDKHRLDAGIWKRRYPEIQVIAPQGSREKIEDVVPVDTTEPQFADSRVQFVTVPGTRAREAALVAQMRNGTTLVLNDILGNIRDASGFTGWLLQVVGFAGKEAQIPKVVKMAMIEDTHALRDQLLQWSLMPSLKRILVSHGSPIEDDPRRTLRELAASLGASTEARAA